MIKSDYFELNLRNWVKRVCLEVKGVVAIMASRIVRANVMENILGEKKDSILDGFRPGLH